MARTVPIFSYSFTIPEYRDYEWFCGPNKKLVEQAYIKYHNECHGEGNEPELLKDTLDNFHELAEEDYDRLMYVDDDGPSTTKRTFREELARRKWGSGPFAFTDY